MTEVAVELTPSDYNPIWEYLPGQSAVEYEGTEPLLEPSRYTSKEILQREYEELWPKVWQMVCREEDIPNVGDVLVYEIGRQSVIITRSKDGVHAFHNSCTHRGAILKTATGNVNDLPCIPGHEGELHCPWHGWTFRMDGSVAHIAAPSAFAPGALNKDATHLKKIKMDTWAGFVYVNFDPDSVSLEEWLSPIPDLCERFPIEDMRTQSKFTVIVPCNWKAAYEQFNDGAHAWAQHILDLNGTGNVATLAGGRQAGNVGTPPADLLLYALFMHLFERHWFFRGALWQPGAGMPMTKLAAVGDDPLEFIQHAMRFMHENYRVPTYEVEFASRLTAADIEPMLDGPAPNFMIWLRKEAAKEQGIDLDDVPDFDLWGFSGEPAIFPNVMGPLTKNSFLCLRFLPNGDDPDTSIVEIRAMFLFGEGKEPEPIVEFYGDWDSVGENLAMEFRQDFGAYDRIQDGYHQNIYTAGIPSIMDHMNVHFGNTIKSYVPDRD